MENISKSFNAYVLTLFPEIFPGSLGVSVIGQALKKKNLAASNYKY